MGNRHLVHMLQMSIAWVAGPCQQQLGHTCCRGLSCGALTRIVALPQAKAETTRRCCKGWQMQRDIGVKQVQHYTALSMSQALYCFAATSTTNPGASKESILLGPAKGGAAYIAAALKGIAIRLQLPLQLWELRLVPLNGLSLVHTMRKLQQFLVAAGR